MHDSCTCHADSESFPPPQRIHLIRVNSTEIVFSWDQTENCPSISYNILSRNCGICPNSTNATSVSCYNFIISESITICTFMVETVTCSNGATPIVGNPSNSTMVNLTGRLYTMIINYYYCDIIYSQKFWHS